MPNEKRMKTQQIILQEIPHLAETPGVTATAAATRAATLQAEVAALAFK